MGSSTGADPPRRGRDLQALQPRRAPGRARRRPAGRRAAAGRDHQGAQPRCQMLILDEPTAVLTPQETDELITVMRALRDGGTSIVFITHKLREVREVADRITVIRRGRVVGSAQPIGVGQRAGLADGRPARPADIEKGPAHAGRRRARGRRRDRDRRRRGGPGRSGELPGASRRDPGAGRRAGQWPDRADPGAGRPGDPERRQDPGRGPGRDRARHERGARPRRRLRPRGSPARRPDRQLHDRREPDPRHLRPPTVRPRIGAEPARDRRERRPPG